MALLDKTHDNLKTIEQLILVKNIEYIQQERASILLDQVYNSSRDYNGMLKKKHPQEKNKISQEQRLSQEKVIRSI